MLTWGLFVASLLWAWSTCWLVFRFWRPTLWLRLAVFALLHTLGITEIPVVGLSPAEYIWSVFSDLSIASFLLISVGLIRILFKYRIDNKQTISFAVSGLMLALVYYPIALTFSSVDIYSWGINSPLLIACIALLALILSFTSFTLVALWGGLALIAWAIELGESVNLIDYLLDPIVAIWCICIVLCWCWRQALNYLHRWCITRSIVR